ncbi:MAG: protoporphyrinogen oxidase HemJ [Hyphomicrobiaceae bacterium]|nr:protoporphyrinogen oxidase HemJ [Hyphomicrobiaceae bacterium]
MSGASADTAGAIAARRSGIAIAAVVAVTALVILVFGADAYDWVKAVHVMAIIAWMAGLLYLPRLFVYHCDAAPGSVQSETFKVMEGRLLTYIMTPATAVAWILGLWLGWQGGWLLQGWFLAKLALVTVMSGMHHFLARAVRAFAEDRNQHSARTWRMLNEIPAVLMIGIVILVVVKPF